MSKIDLTLILPLIKEFIYQKQHLKYKKTEKQYIIFPSFYKVSFYKISLTMSFSHLRQDDVKTYLKSK